MTGYRIDRGVAVLEVAQPPLNGLNRAVRASLMEAIDRAEEDDAAFAIVIVGAGGTFPAGADILEYDSGLAEPSLGDLCDRVEYSDKPVVAALTGTVYGGGLELALAAHYRVAQVSARLALPEVHLGLPPAGGGSQRLPRLVGAELALAMMLQGKPVSAGSAEGGRLVHLRSDGDALEAAIAFCGKLREAGRGPLRLSEQTAGAGDPAGYQAAIAQARAALDPEDGLGAELVRLVEAAALLPYEAGRSLEAAIFDDCLGSTRSKALRHAFLAERRAASLGARTAFPEGQRIALFGGGLGAVQIAERLLAAGLSIDWAAREPLSAQTVRGKLKTLLGQGNDALDAMLQRVNPTTCNEAAATADVVLLCEAGFSDLRFRPETLVLDASGEAVTTLGLRFLPPAHLTRLVEVLMGPKAQRGPAERCFAFLNRINRLPVQVFSTRDTLAGRLSHAMQRAADALVDIGCSPYAIDLALLDWGLPQGVFAARDRRSLGELGRLSRVAGRNWSAALAAEGRLGAAEGGGFYDWKAGQPFVSEDVRLLLDETRSPQDLPGQTILKLMVGAMANEGLRLMEEGKARSASDLDVVSIHALGLPRAGGGVMKAVSLWGPFPVMRLMERIQHPDRAFWDPRPEWARLVKNGLDFDAAKPASPS